MNAEGILYFWFEQIDPIKWWAKDEQFDQTLKLRFRDIHTAARKGMLADWRETPRGRLAEIIILDQMSRNIYRGRPESFASDALALKLAKEAIELDADKDMDDDECMFLYMPFMHSENARDHIYAVELFSSRPGLDANLDFELKHKEIIDRFGRYPHRNEILGRESTPEEEEFLLEPGSSF